MDNHHVLIGKLTITGNFQWLRNSHYQRVNDPKVLIYPELTLKSTGGECLLTVPRTKPTTFKGCFIHRFGVLILNMRSTCPRHPKNVDSCPGETWNPLV